MSANGFTVVDLGVNVKIDRFVNEIKERKPDIVAMSALLTTTAPNQGKVIKLLQKEGSATSTSSWSAAPRPACSGPRTSAPTGTVRTPPRRCAWPRS